MEVQAVIPHTGMSCYVTIQGSSKLQDIKQQIADGLDLDIHSFRIEFNDCDLAKTLGDDYLSKLGMTQDDVLCVVEDKWGHMKEAATKRLQEAGTAINADSMTLAVERGKKDEVIDLLAAGVDVNAGDSIGDTSVHAAARKGDHDMLEFLFNEGGELNTPNRTLSTPLHRAVCFPVTVAFLMSKGAPHSPVNTRGVTPFLDAVLNGKLESVDILLRAGADPTHKTAAGQSALFFVQDLELARYLVSKGCPMDPDEEGNTVLHMSVMHAPEEVSRYFLSLDERLTTAVNKDGDTPLHLLCDLMDKHFMFEAVAGGGAVNVQNKKGETPLFNAVRIGSQAGISTLVHLGSNTEIMNIEGNTPLHVAVLSGKQHIVDRCLPYMSPTKRKNQAGHDHRSLARINEVELPPKSVLLDVFRCTII
eukprot:TRINITY_DN15028_c0_g1_i1.p1 TRINITY_DN15028_c0_g1~~TRINITY_DN15028_c0_g1_i1.p1  ORF type:complete len:419 (+),score=130.80 TRINITY_DN15028_c0_g1_i1:576-1832(+)